MARVYRAVRRGPMGFRKELAIKAIRTSGSGDGETLAQSLVNEARLGGQLRHPNLADTYEFGTVGDQFYIALEFVNGPTLRTLLTGARERDLHLPWGAVLDLALQACDALHYAHTARGDGGEPLHLIHRDLKPGNVIVSTAGLAKVMDFGIARSASALFSTTVTGGIRGTPGFVSPEQLEDPDGIDARSDLFALGAILFECVTGEPLVPPAGLEAMMWSVASGGYRSRLELVEASLPEATPVIARCLERDPGNRHPDAHTLAEGLRDVRDRLGDDQGCRELMQLLSAHAARETGALMAAGDRIVQRGERANRDTGWGALVDGLLSDPAADDDALRLGFHPPLGEIDAAPGPTRTPGERPTVVWQADDVATVVGRPAGAVSESEPMCRTIESPPPSRLRRAGLFGLGCLVGVPFVVGLLVLVFDEPSRIVTYGGPFMFGIVGVAVLACGLVALKGVGWRSRSVPIASLMSLPLLTAGVGSMATHAGATIALQALPVWDHAARPDVYRFVNRASAISLYPDFAGLVLMAALLLASAAVIALAQRARAGGEVSHTALVQIGVAMGGGCLLWVLHPWLTARDGAGGPAPFIVFLVLVGCSLACAALAGPSDDERASRSRWLVASCTILAVAAAARAVDIQQQMHLFAGFSDLEVVDGLAAARRFSDAVIFETPWAVVAWTALAVVIATITVAGRPRPAPRPWRLLGPALLLALLLGGRALASRAVVDLVAMVVPSYLNASVRWHMGIELEDEGGPLGSAGRVVVSLAPEDAPVRTGDVVVAVNRTAVTHVRDLLQRLGDCRCDREPECTLGTRCFEAGESLSMDIVRPGDDGSGGTLETVQLPWLGGESPSLDSD